jgi:hypothetical protein
MNIILRLIPPNIKLWEFRQKPNFPFIKSQVNSPVNPTSLDERKLSLHSPRDYTHPVNHEENFHRAHLSLEEGVGHALSHKFLRELVQQIKANNDFQSDSTAIIPFGGPGSMAVYLSNEDIRTLSGDINYKPGTLYGTAEERLRKSATNPKAKIELMKFQEWDATQLPLASDSQSLMIINPPYGIKCNLFSSSANKESPERLLSDSLKEALRVLKTKGIVYIFWPNQEINNIKKIIEPNFNLSNETIIPGNNLELSLIRLEKK